MAHEGMNNFYNEAAPVKNLLKIGSIIPVPALPSCISALLCVVLGNSYGTAWSATPDAYRLLESLTSERWAYYLNQVLPGDIRILNKLLDENHRSNWIKVAQKFGFQELEIKDKDISKLIKASMTLNEDNIIKIVRKLRKFHIGKKA